MEITVRDAELGPRTSDMSIVAKFADAYAIESAGGEEGVAPVSWYRGLVNNPTFLKNFHGFVAEDSEEAVGHLLYTETKGGALINQLFVDKNSRGQGVEKSLVEKTAQRVRAMRKLEGDNTDKALYVEADNGLVDIYAACGFETVTVSPKSTVMGLDIQKD